MDMPRSPSPTVAKVVEMSRRSYGSGQLVVRADSKGRETFYGRWHDNGVRVKRRLGVKRPPGARDGLTKAQAEAELRRQMLEVAPVSVGTRLTVADAAERYMAAAKRKGRKASTLANFESEVRVHMVPFFGGRTLEAIGFKDVASFIERLEKKKLAPKTIRNIVANLSALFNYGMLPQQGWAASNPCRGAELPAVPEAAEPRFLTLEEIDALIAHIPESIFTGVDRALILTAVQTGLRKGELVALRWRDVDWQAQRIRVVQSYTRGEFTTPKSGHKRSVPMTDEVAGALDRLHQDSTWKHDGDLVFAHPATGGVLPKSNISRRVKVALDKAGLPPHRVHDLRHSFGTQLAKQGIPIRALQEFMGHADYKTTLRYAAYAPAARDAELIGLAFTRGSIRGPVLREPDVASGGVRAVDTGDTA